MAFTRTAVPPDWQEALAWLTSHPARQLWVAYSGGRDSHALLHWLAAHEDRHTKALRAVHVDHGLQPGSKEWTQHCAAVCRQLNVPLQCLTVQVAERTGQSTEAAAREARYQAVMPLLAEGDALLTAHHQDDQAETVVLQLLRGAGPRGLAAMPREAHFGVGWLLRPWLAVSAATIRSYADHHALSFVTDPSNDDDVFDRNFLRHHILPQLRERWPAMALCLSRSAQWCAEQTELASEAARQDLQQCQGLTQERLSSAGLLALSAPRQRACLRAWFHQAKVRAPSAERLQRILDEVLNAAVDRQPRVAWDQVELRRYQGELWLLPQLEPVASEALIPWDGYEPLSLPGSGELRLVVNDGGGLPLSLRGKSLTLGFRRGGEMWQPASGAKRRPLKRWLQEQAMPPWERQRLPLLFWEDALLAAGPWVAADWQTAPGSPGLVLQWQKPTLFNNV